MKIKSLLFATFAIIGITSISFAQNIPYYVPSDTILGWWSYSGTAIDESGNNNHGFVTGATLTTDRFGTPNSAYLFSQNCKIRNSKNDTLYKNSFSYSFWVNPTQTLGLPNEGDSSNTISIQRQCVIHPNHGLMYGPSSTNAGSGVYVGTNGVVVLEHSHNYIKRALVYSVTLTGWHHIVIVYNNKIPSLYINGQFIKNGVLSSRNVHPSLGFDSTIVTTHNFSNSGIGAGLNNQYNSGHFFNGKIDDIGIWGRCLTTKEIQDLYFGCITAFISTEPVNQSAYINNSAHFSVGSLDSNVTYQWQTNTGLGFQDISDLGQYTGSNTDSLTVSYLTMANNNHLFRCIVGYVGCQDTSAVVTLTVIDNTGISDNFQDNLLTVFPNPTEDVINVKADPKLVGSVYTVYDNVGKIVISGMLNSEITVIELANLAGGIYLFRVGDNMKQTFKVIKK